MLGNKQFFIFSAELSTNTDEQNHKNNMCLIAALKSLKIPFKSLEGMYQGTIEKSYLVEAKHEDLILAFAEVYDQESILFVDALSNASLIYLGRDNPEVKLGKFKQVAYLEALGRENYTRDVYNNTYWTVK